MLSGEKVTGNVGGDLNIESKQDSNSYKEKNTSAGLNLDLNLNNGKIGVSGGASKENIDSNYNSVKDRLIQKSIYLKRREPEINSTLEMCKEHRRLAYEQLHESIIEREEFQRTSGKIRQEIPVCRNELLTPNDEYEKEFREHAEMREKIEKMRRVLKSEEFFEDLYELFAYQVQVIGDGAIALSFL